MHVLNRNHLQYWPTGAVYIGRGTALGNPYVIGEHGDRDAVCDQYDDWLAYKIDKGDPVVLTALMGLHEDSSLICSCAPARCHGNGIEAAWKRLRETMLPTRSRSQTYTGIGSRRTPVEEIRRMKIVAERLALRGYTLRSGAAEGADVAFESGAGAKKEIFLPWAGFNGKASTFQEPTREAIEVARKLQARNSHQILGADLRTPADFVVCWTPDGCESESARTRDTGGTGQAIALASRWGIPVFNLARKDALYRLKQLLDTAT